MSLGGVTVFSAKRWGIRNGADLAEFVTPCHDTPVVGPNWLLNTLCPTVLTSKSEDYHCATTPSLFSISISLFQIF